MITEKQLHRALKLKDRIAQVQSDIRKIEDMAMNVANNVMRTDVMFSMIDVLKPKEEVVAPAVEEIDGQVFYKLSLDDFKEEDELFWEMSFEGTDFLLVLQGMLNFKNKQLERWQSELKKIVEL